MGIKIKNSQVRLISLLQISIWDTKILASGKIAGEVTNIYHFPCKIDNLPNDDLFCERIWVYKN